MQAAKKFTIFFAQAKEFDFAGLVSELFELTKTLLVHGLSSYRAEIVLRIARK